MSAIPAELPAAAPWRKALPLLVLLLAALLLLYHDTAVAMATIWWRSETFAHCLLVLPITLWLVWRKRQELAALTPRPAPVLLMPLAAAALVWLLADVTTVNVVEQFALVTMLVLAVPLVLGWQVGQVLLFPLLFLFFGVPFGEFMLPTMMEATADFTVWALQASGIPVYREGQQFLIPSGSWSVIDECSGVRYLMASFMVGTLFAYLNYSSYRRRIVFMIVSILVPILANWLRAYMIVMLAHLSGNKLAVGVDHILYGWVFFGVIVFIMFMVGARWSQPEAPPQVFAPPPAQPPGALRNAMLAALAVVALPMVALLLLQRWERAAPAPQLALPEQMAGGWQALAEPLLPWQPDFSQPSAQAQRWYAGPQGKVGVYLAYYRGQAEDRKLVSSSNALVHMRDKQWSLPVNATQRQAGGATFRSVEIPARVQLNAELTRRLVVWRCYWIDGRWVTSDVRAKLQGGLARLQGHGDEGAALLLSASEDTAAASQAALQAFVQANLGTLDALLTRTHGLR